MLAVMKQMRDFYVNLSLTQHFYPQKIAHLLLGDYL